VRKYARVDDNQKEIVQALRDIGATVESTATIGGGFADIVVGFRNKNYLIEIKDGSKPPSRQKLTPDETEFHAKWQGQIDVARSVDEALKIIGVVGYAKTTLKQGDAI
jgi:hypothetical protein